MSSPEAAAENRDCARAGGQSGFYRGRRTDLRRSMFSIQAQIMNLMERLRPRAKSHGTFSFLTIFAPYRHVSDRVAVMYGQTCGDCRCEGHLRQSIDALHEGADVGRFLLRSKSRSHSTATRTRRRRAVADQSSQSCRFHTRCP